MTVGIMLRRLRGARHHARQRRRTRSTSHSTPVGAQLTLRTGDEAALPDQVNDVVNIREISGPATIALGGGNDTIRVNFDDDGDADVRQRHRRRAHAARRRRQRPLRDRPLRPGLADRPARPHQRRRHRADRRPGRQPAAHLRHRRGRLLPAARQPGDRPDRHRRRVRGRRRPAAGPERLLRARSTTTATSTAAVEIFGREGDDTFVLDDNLRADDDLRRRAATTRSRSARCSSRSRDGPNPDNGLDRSTTSRPR